MSDNGLEPAGEPRDVGALVTAVGDNERSLQIGVAAMGAATLVVWTRPTGLVVLLIAIVVLLAVAAIGLVAQVARTSKAALSGVSSAANKSPVDIRE